MYFQGAPSTYQVSNPKIKYRERGKEERKIKRNTHIQYSILNIHVNIYTFISFLLINKTTFLWKIAIFNTLSAILTSNFNYNILHNIIWNNELYCYWSALCECSSEVLCASFLVRSGIENRDYGHRGSAAQTIRHPSIRKKLTLTSPTSGGRSVGIVRSRT
jgi:hypothetical protein